MDVLHGDVVAAVDLSEVEDLDDVRMGEAGDHLGLVDEHVHEFLVVREVGQDPLHRHDLLEPLDPAALGAEDLGHPAHRHALEQAIRSVRWRPRAGSPWPPSLPAARDRFRRRSGRRGRSWPPRRGRPGRSRRLPAPASPAASRPGTWWPSAARAGRRTRSGARERAAPSALRRDAASGGSAGPPPWSPFRAGRARAGWRVGPARARAVRAATSPSPVSARALARLGERIEQRGDVVRQRAVFAGAGQRRRFPGRAPGLADLDLDRGVPRARRPGGRRRAGGTVASGVVEHVPEDVLGRQEVTFSGRRCGPAGLIVAAGSHGGVSLECSCP